MGQLKSFVISVGGVIWGFGTWPFGFFIHLLESMVETILLTAKTTVQKLLFSLLASITITLISILSYAAFLNLYLPTAEISRPVYLAFSVCPSGHGICSFPSANVTFFNDQGTRQEVLGAGQVYRIVLDIDMPDTPNNRNIGMFQVKIEMFDRNGHISSLSQRAAMPKYRSAVMRMLDVVIFCPFYFFGLMEPKQTLSVELVSHYVDDYYHSSVGARIEVQSYSIQFYSVILKLFANFSGLKYFLYYWPVFSAFCGIVYNIILLSSLVVGATYKKAEALRKISETLQLQSCVNQQQDENDNDDDNKEDEEETTGATGEEKDSCTESESPQQTKPDDDLETEDTPLIQEPVDFLSLEEEQDLDLVSNLRHRRVN